MIGLDRPKLRAIEAVVVRDATHGRSLMLRDTEGFADHAIAIPGHLAAVVGRFDGVRTLAEVALEASRAVGKTIDVRIVAQLAKELDAAFLLESPRFRARRADRLREFARSPVRRAWHAGGAYHDEPRELRKYIEDECLARAPSASNGLPLVGLCAPHMDLWRAAVGYGYAYRALLASLRDDVETFVLLGTSHAPMRRPFSICDKAFETPLGALEPDASAIQELVRGTRFNLFEEEHFHRSEHSLEFQAVFLRYALGERRARIVPVLCGLGEAQATGRDPSSDPDAESFLDQLAAMIERRGHRVIVIAGADLAHVGPRFGDPEPLDQCGREELRRRDLASLDHALGVEEGAFFDHAVADLSTRRICGVGPIYTMLRTLPRGTRGELLHYTQCVDPDEGSIVSHASLAFTL
jgi:AmmeMemoRadiSam system protein B